MRNTADVTGGKPIAGISETPLLLLRGSSVSGMYVYYVYKKLPFESHY
jgi:hypothetical protein